MRLESLSVLAKEQRRGTTQAELVERGVGEVEIGCRKPVAAGAFGSLNVADLGQRWGRSRTGDADEIARELLG